MQIMTGGDCSLSSEIVLPGKTWRIFDGISVQFWSPQLVAANTCLAILDEPRYKRTGDFMRLDVSIRWVTLTALTLALVTIIFRSCCDVDIYKKHFLVSLRQSKVIKWCVLLSRYFRSALRCGMGRCLWRSSAGRVVVERVQTSGERGMWLQS